MAMTPKPSALADRLPAALKKSAAVDPFAIIAAASLAEIDALGRKKNAALHVACEKQRSDLVAALLARGAAPSAHGEHGDTPLHVAAIKRDLASMHLLLDAGADPRALNRWGESTLHAAGFGASRACIEALLDRPGAPDLHGLGDARRSVVALACWGLHRDEDAALDAVTCLIDRGASVDTFDAVGQSPLHFACGASMRRVARLVAAHATAVDATGLLAAVGAGWLEVAETLVARTGGVGAYAGPAAEGAFLRAGNAGAVESCAWVLARWADVAVRERRVCEWPLQRAVTHGNEAMVEYLLGLGAPADFPLEGAGAYSLLEYALMHRQWAIVPMLIAHGASTDVRWCDEHLAAAPAEVRALFGVPAAG